jgi:hypothetical protein
MSRRTCVRWATLIAFVTPLLVATAGSAVAAPIPESAVRSAAATAPVPVDCTAAAPFKAKAFPYHPRVDNTWFPLVPGTNFVMEGTVVDDAGETHTHRIVTTVTDLTKLIDGVRSVIVFDRDFDNGELQESELAFMAQDKNSRVWNVGEYPEEYVHGKLDGAPSTWISGIARARAGVGMQPVPRVGTDAYLQGVAPKVDFRDCAQVVHTGRRVCVPVHCYDHVLVIEEWAPLDPAGGHQLKYYAPGVGNVQVGAVGGDTAEVLQLIELKKLNAKDMSAVRNAVLAQDRRGYAVSHDVYARTEPATR